LFFFIRRREERKEMWEVRIIALSGYPVVVRNEGRGKNHLISNEFQPSESSALGVGR
jgi:hypothetical protein